MKIAIPNIVYDDNFEDNVSFTLRNMGHEVYTMPKPISFFKDSYRHLYLDLKSKFFPNRFTIQEKWLLHLIDDIKIELVLCLTQSLKEEVLIELNKKKIITTCWWGDTAANMRNQGLLCNGWTALFIKDKFAVTKLRSLNLNAFYLPEAMNPSWHKKMYYNIGDQISIAGSVYEYRHFLIRSLLKAGKNNIKLYGNKPPAWAEDEVKALYQMQYVVKERKSEVFGSSLACINSTSMTEFDSLNCRAFELAGAEALQIMENRPSISDCFDIGSEIAVYDTIYDLVDKLEKAKLDSQWATKIRKNGAKRANDEHTYEIRLNNILKILKEAR